MKAKTLHVNNVGRRYSFLYTKVYLILGILIFGLNPVVAQTTTTSATLPPATQFYDFDGAGGKGFVLGQIQDGLLQITLHNGISANFSLRQSLENYNYVSGIWKGNDSFTLTLDDVNRDGKPDVGIVHGCPNKNADTTLVSNPDGSYRAIRGGLLPNADLNMDGKIDLLDYQLGYATNFAYLLFQQGNGSFSQTFLQKMTSAEYEASFDQAAYEAYLAAVQANKRSPRPNFSAFACADCGPAPDLANTKPAQCVDLNGDGIPDLLADGSGLAFFSTESPEKFVMQTFGNRVKARDLNGDGFTDFVIWDNAAQQLKTLVYRGNGNYQETVLMSDIPADKEIYCYDFDKDGDIDILATFSYPYNNTGSFTLVAINDGDGNFTTNEDGSTTDKFYYANCKDINNDGFYDLLVLDVSGMSDGYQSDVVLPVKVKYGQAGGNFSAAQFLYNTNEGTHESFAWSVEFPELILNIADIDNDNKAEIWYTGKGAAYNYAGDNYYFDVETATVNTAPATPAAPQVLFDATTGRLEITWSAASDTQSSPCDLTYEIRIGTAPGLGDVLFAHANADGTRRNFRDGNAGYNRTKVLDVSSWLPDTYYIAVQAIDPQHAGSAWSTETVFTNTMLTSKFTVDKTSLAFCDSLTVYYSPIPAGYTMNWSLDGATQLTSTSEGELHLQWTTSGKKTISLQITAPDGTTSETTVQTIDVLNNYITATETDQEDASFINTLYQGWFADWDLNGKQDVLLNGWGNNNETITGLWKNDGTGNFNKLGKLFNLTFAPTHAKWLDWDRDGVMDLFYGNRDNYGNHGWLKNNLSDNFTKTDITLTTPLYNNMFSGTFFNMADLNNDGLLEPLKWYWSNDNQNYEFLKNGGNGVFTTAGTIEHSTIGIYETDLVNNVVDWNKDGFLDYYTLASTKTGVSYTYSGVKLFVNKGNFNFEYKEIPFETPITINQGFIDYPVFADFDNDGYLDIAFCAGEKRIQILKNEGNERFVVGDAIVIDNPDISVLSNVRGQIYNPVLKGDLDNNGYLDLLLDVNIQNQKAGVYVIYNDGNGNYRQGLFSDISNGLASDVYYSSILHKEDLAKNYNVIDTDGDDVPNIYLGSSGYNEIGYGIYNQHLTNRSNTAPQAPTGLIATQTDTTLVIEWDAAVDAETPAMQMRYNISVKKAGLSGAGSYIISPLNGGNATAAALPSPQGGVRLGDWVFADYTASKQYIYPVATRFEIPLSALPEGNVEISVQAIDLWDAVSPFSAVLIKNIEASASFTLPATACFDNPVEIKYNGTQGGATPTWDFDGGTVVSGTGFGPYLIKWNNDGIKTISLTAGTNTFNAQIKVLPEVSAAFTLSTLLPLNTEMEIGLPVVPQGSTFSWLLSGYSSSGNSGTGNSTVAGKSEHTLSARPGNTKGSLKIIGGNLIYRELTLTVTTPNGCTKSFTKGFTVVAAIEPPVISLVYPNASNRNVIAWDVADIPENTTEVVVYKEGSALNDFREIGRVSPFDGTFTDPSSNTTICSERYAISAVLSSGVESSKSQIHQTLHLTINRGAISGTWNLIWNAYVGRDMASYRILQGASPDNLTQLAELSSIHRSYTHVDNPSAPYYAIEYVPAQSSYGAPSRQRSIVTLDNITGRSNVVFSGNANQINYVTQLNIQTQAANTDLSETQPSIYLYAEVFPTYATYQNTVWSIVSGNQYATIDANGKLSATRNTIAGTVTVQATASDGSGITATRTFNVSAFTPVTINVIGIQLNKTTSSLVVGTSEQLIATVLPTNANNQNVTWNSDNTAVATVNNGLVSAFSVGTTIISVTTVDGGFRAECTISVIPTSIESIEASKISIYPNPAESYLFIDGGGQSMERIRIINISGVIVAEENAVSGKIDVSRLSEGIYFLIIQTDKKEYQTKFIKK